jgi:hypothetical protein
MAYTYEFELGDRIDGMLNVEDATSLSVPPHPWTYKRGRTRFTAGTGRTYYDGYPEAQWTFEFVPLAGWLWLQDLLQDDDSIEVFVKTKVDDESYQIFAAIMHRPDVGDDAQRAMGQGYTNVKIKFTHMVLQEES